MGELVRAEAEIVNVVSAPPARALPAEALERLPGDGDTDPYWRLGLRTRTSRHAVTIAN